MYTATRSSRRLEQLEAATPIDTSGLTVHAISYGYKSTRSGALRRGQDLGENLGKESAVCKYERMEAIP